MCAYTKCFFRHCYGDKRRDKEQIFPKSTPQIIAVDRVALLKVRLPVLKKGLRYGPAPLLSIFRSGKSSEKN